MLLFCLARYTTDWMYRCMLFRIQGPVLYRKLREENILPLPSLSTLQRKCRGLRATYGFQDTLFENMHLKANSMDKMLRRGKFNAFFIQLNFLFKCVGVLMIDEMKVTPDTKFNISTHKVCFQIV